MTNGKVYDYLVVATSWAEARQWAEARGMGTNQWLFVNVDEGLPEPGKGHFTSAWWDNVAVTDGARGHENLEQIRNRAKYYQTEPSKPANGTFRFLYGEKR